MYGAAASKDGEAMLDGRETGSVYGGVSAPADGRPTVRNSDAAPTAGEAAP